MTKCSRDPRGRAQSAIGEEIDAEHVTERTASTPSPSVVVGVVEHIHNHSLTQRVRGQIYMPFEQSPRSPLTFVVRTRVTAALALVPAVRKRAAAADQDGRYREGPAHDRSTSPERWRR